METQVIKANAKINISLKVLNKRNDGYHNLDMLMATLDLCDVLYIEEIQYNNIIIEMTEDICDLKDNVCYKMIRKIQDKYNISKGIKLSIQKNIPFGAGLGGGSADAAALLKCLNKMWELNMSVQEMIDFSKELGSDIPYCIVQGLARVQKTGNEIIPLDIEFDKNVILIVPDEKLSTKNVFQEFNHKDKSEKSITNAINKFKKEGLLDTFNDLQPAADRLTNDLIKDIINKCKAIGLNDTFMTGSGSTVVVLTDKTFDIKEKVKMLESTVINAKIITTSLKMYTY